MFFSETKLKENDLSDNFKIKNYYIYRLDQKTSTPYHGIIAYVHKSIKVLDVKFHRGTIAEAISIMLKKNYKKHKITGLYIAPQTDYSYIQQILEWANDDKANVTVIGDFNVNIRLSTNNNFTETIKRKYKLSQMMSQFTTKYLTTIDLIFSNYEQQETTSIPVHWSDHNIIATELKKSK